MPKDSIIQSCLSLSLCVYLSLCLYPWIAADFNLQLLLPLIGHEASAYGKGCRHRNHQLKGKSFRTSLPIALEPSLVHRFFSFNLSKFPSHHTTYLQMNK